jgi:hypothetical protein
MNAYRCWHYLCRETAAIVVAASSFEARRIMASRLSAGLSDIVAQRIGR